MPYVVEQCGGNTCPDITPVERTNKMRRDIRNLPKNMWCLCFWKQYFATLTHERSRNATLGSCEQSKSSNVLKQKFEFFGR